MAYFIVTLSREVFFQLLSHAPEALKTSAEEEAKRAIPALCFTEDDIRQKFAEVEQWDAMSEDEQHEALEMLMDAGEYEYAGTAANQSIAEAVARFLLKASIGEDEGRVESESTW